ncbi:N-acetylglucosaminyl transferase component Gpi1 [Babesia ovis]|uniref:N-acetylglucosaminyl transferase component Gpi1 n=1 Tax=Babesia ovis TaxID=5869 RepID=A0A9W5TBS3_BABOV|nr:N-acetylglucosaminyl transferase component Gpi1 [Babesia ovis]
MRDITVYLPVVEYHRACAGESKRLLVGWNIPCLKTTVVVTSYPSSQLSVVNSTLRELADMPCMRDLFSKHGPLSVLDISFQRGDDGVVLSSSDLKCSCVQLVKYNADDFNVVSYTELSSVLNNAFQQSASNCNDVSQQKNICSYLIVGCALVEYLDDRLCHALTTSSRQENSESSARPQVQRKQTLVFYRWKRFLYSIMVQIVLWLSLAAQFTLSLQSKITQDRLRRLLHNLTCVNLLHNRLTQMAGWSDAYRLMQSQTDILEYVRFKHSIRQSVWSIIVDVIVGILEFTFLRRTVVYAVNMVRLLSRDFYISTIKYISYNFAMRIGKYCKLNDEVAVFLSRLIISILIVWRAIVPTLRQYFYVLSRLFQYSALCGITYQMAVFLDIVSIETLHMAYAHCVLLYITKWTQRYQFSLLQLIKGKKWNELKQALDSNDYTREQLFLGTVIFTLLLLIYPTIWVFYCVTLVVYLPLFVTRALVKGLIEIMTKIPYYFIAYNVIFPRHYKENIYFVHPIHWDNALYGMEGKELAPVGNNPKHGDRFVEGARKLEVKCSPFSSNTILKPMIQALKSCKANLFFWRIV